MNIETLSYISVFVGIVTLCFINIPEKLYKLLHWLILLAVIGITLLIINNLISIESTSPIVDFMQSNGLGDPRGWVNNSLIYRDSIQGVYYLVFIGSVLMFLLGLVHEDSIVAQLKSMPVWKNVMAFSMFSFTFYLFIFIFGQREIISDMVELKKHRMSYSLLNTTLGLVIFEYLIFSISKICAKYIRWAVCQLKSKYVFTQGECNE